MNVDVGDQLPVLEVTISREGAVRYAGASTDFNPIHWSDEAARAIGLDGVIVHGMWTMGAALRVVTDWIGDPARVVDYFVRFARPVRVPATPQGVVVRFTGRVTQVAEGIATVALDATCGDEKVLAAAKVEVRVD